MNTISSRLKEIRQYLNYNQQQLADELGISRAHISNMENGKDNPSSSLIKLICVKYNINEAWLVNGAEGGSMIPEYNTETDEGLKAKYNFMRFFYDKMVNERTGNDLKYTVEAFAFFMGLVQAAHLEDDERTKYLESIYKWMDAYEVLQYEVSRIKNKMTKKTPDRHWERFLKECNARFEISEKSMKDALNIYLCKYGEDRIIE